MSLSFQRLQGDQTVDGQMLTDLDQINAKLDRLVAPDLKAWFRLYFPALPIIPYYKTFFFMNAVQIEQFAVIGKKLFAEAFVSVDAPDEATTDTVETGARLRMYHGADIVHSVSAGFAGAGPSSVNSTMGDFVGIFDKIGYVRMGSSERENFGHVVVRGFEIPANYDITVLSAMPPETVVALANPQTVPADFPRRFTINNVPDGINFSHAGLAGNTTFELYYIEGSNFLTPDVQYTRIPAGGFTLTGFAPLVAGQTLLMIL